MKIRAVGAVALFLSLLSMLSTSARAQEAAPPPPAAPSPAVGGPPAPGAFGSQGQLVLSTDLPLHQSEPMLALVHESQSMGGGSSTLYAIEPALDYFVAPNLSVGGAIGVIHGVASADGIFTGDATVTAIEILARVGYNVVFTDAFSLWPRLSIGYEHVSVSSGGSSASGYVVPLSIFAPVLWHPAQHFFVGLGPILSTQLENKSEGNPQPKATDIGIEGTLGGYFSL